jgi:translation initiation factor 1 (eIF-1/SUI1)
MIKKLKKYFKNMKFVLLMNPFEDIPIKNDINNEYKNDIINDYKIDIWVENFGKKKNTYISGWILSEPILKNHIKNIKKKNGCNGTIKKISIDSLEKTVIHLQGNHIDFMKNYLLDNGIELSNINIKG